jgi:hypothetical protein
MGWVRGSHVARPPLTGRTGPRACPGTPWRVTHQCNDQASISRLPLEARTSAPITSCICGEPLRRTYATRPVRGTNGFRTLISPRQRRFSGGRSISFRSGLRRLLGCCSSSRREPPLERPHPFGAGARCSLVRYLEPGRKRRRRRTPAHLLWLIAVALAVAVATQIFIR